jgi:mevalonate pyrophosphate decarboxylase
MKLHFFFTIDAGSNIIHTWNHQNLRA